MLLYLVCSQIGSVVAMTLKLAGDSVRRLENPLSLFLFLKSDDCNQHTSWLEQESLSLPQEMATVNKIMKF